MSRIIGISHRVKRTADNEARPTLIAFDDGRCYELATETDELDFVRGRFPIEYRAVRPDEDLSVFPEHQIVWRPLKKEEDIQAVPETHRRLVGKKYEVLVKVPSEYDGTRNGDILLMPLGGSGDALAYALSRHGQAIGARVYRVPPKVLKTARDTRSWSKDQDPELLIALYRESPDEFHLVGPRERTQIEVRERYFLRQDALKARIACEQRLRARTIGRVFMSEDGGWPEGTVQDEFDAVKANDAVFQGLSREEDARTKELYRLIEGLPVYQQLFEPITGVGPRIAAPIIAAVPDILLFETKHKLKAFLGVHVLSDGRFPRRRSGELANWNAEARQALYLLGDQFNRRPESEWGKKLIENKRRYRERHPETEIAGKKRYTNAHVHRTATWRTLTQFVEQLWGAWTKLERAAREGEADKKAA